MTYALEGVVTTRDCQDVVTSVPASDRAIVFSDDTSPVLSYIAES